MKAKSIVFIITAITLSLAAFFVGTKDNEHFTPAAAEGLKTRIDTPAPYSTSVPSFAVQVLQKYAHSKVLTRTAHGVEMSAANFRIEGDDFMVDVCFQPPNNNDWLYQNAVIQFGSETRTIYESVGFEIVQTLQNGEKLFRTFSGNPPQYKEKKIEPTSLPDYRCDTLKFRLRNAMPSRIVLKISAIDGISPEGKGCEQRDAVQSILDAKRLGIKIDCTLTGHGAKTSIVEKPENMSDEEARKFIIQARRQINVIEGPWVFEGEVMNMTDPAAIIEPVPTELPIEAAVPPGEAVAPAP